jgi:peptide/nickel transport system substrate-binding protein/oligopeptide transport system substrate-binding protein
VERLFDGTEGNPFFTKELVRSLMDAGRISRDETGDWSLSAEAGIAMDELPATIQQAVEKRIEGLPDDIRDILSIASVLGKSFDSRDLEVLAEGKGDLDDALDRLVADGYLEEERESRGDVLAFSSGVVRDVLYAGLTRRKRRSYHRKCAELIEKRHAGRLDRVLPQLVHHYSQGDVPEKTIEYGLQLAQTSLDAFSPEEAARSAKMALEFLDEEWEGDHSLEGDARVILAQAERMSGNIDGALKEAAHAIRIFEKENQLSRAVDTFRLAAETAWQARRSDETSRWVEKGLTAARGSEERDTLRHLLSLAATLANLRGEYDKANGFLNEAAQLEDSKESDRGEEVPTGGRLVVAMANPINATQPVEIRLLEEEEILSNVFETLVTTDAEGHLVSALCETWDLAEEGRSLRLKLREDVRFQDGAPLTAQDVKLSFETAIGRLTGETPAAFVAIEGWEAFTEGDGKELSGIVVHSDYELEFRLQEPLPIYPALLTHMRTGIVRTTMNGDQKNIVGTGPFRMTSHAKDKVVLERNDDHWRSSRPALDAIEFQSDLSAKDIVRHFRAGDVDVARDLLPEDLEEILRDPRYRQKMVEVAKKNTYFVLFNILSGPIAKDPEVRRALSGVIHTRDLVWRTLGSFAQPAACLIPPGMLGHDPGRRALTFTNVEARKVLESAGVELPLRLKASVHPLIQDRYGSLLTDVLSTWSEIGVDVSVETSDISDYLKSWKENEAFDLTIGRWNADYNDPDNFTYTLFHSNAGGLKRYFSSEESDQILEEARSSAEPKTRESSYRKFENLLVETHALVPLFHDVDYRLAGPKVMQLKLRGSAPYVNYQEIGRRDLSKTDPEARWTARGTVQVPIAGVVHSLDPITSDTTEQGEAIPSIYECLLRAIGGTRIVPWLAEEFKAEQGGRTYRFRLRGEVRFHDGRRLTVRDVRYTFERLLQSQESKDRWFMAPIRGAKDVLEGKTKDLSGFRIHSATEFSIELEEPVGFFPALIAWQITGIMPEGSDPERDRRWIGTGPFRVVNFEAGKRLELERNKAYWRKGYPRSAGLVYTFGVPPKDMLAGFREGRFALASDLFPTDAEALRREPEYASGYREIPQLITYFIGLNVNRGPLKDLALRKRLMHALNVPRIIRQTLGQLAMPATSFIPPGLLGHDPDSSTPASDESETISGEIELKAGVHPLFFDKYAAIYKELTAAWSAVGVKVQVINSNMEELLAELEQASADIFIGRWTADYPDSDTFLYLLHTTSPFMGKVCCTEEIDRLAEKGRVESSPSVRHTLYREFEELLAREAILLPLFYEQSYRFARPEVDGLSLSVGAPTVDYANLRVRD